MFERLQQVVDGVDAKGIERVLLVGRQENHGRHPLRSDLFDDLEAGEARHAHVEEHEVRRELANCPYGFKTIGTHRDDVDVGFRTQVKRDALASKRFVVDDGDAQFHTASAGETRDGAIGTLIVTRVPSPGRLSIANAWSVP